MARNTANPPFDAAFVGCLDVSDADTVWHDVTSADFYDQHSDDVTAKLDAGLLLVGVVVDAVDDDGATAFRFRFGGVAANDETQAGAHSFRVPPGGARSESVRGLTGGPTTLAYKQGTSSKNIYLTAYFEAP